MIDQRPQKTYNTSVKLSFGLEDVTAKSDSTFSVTGGASYSKTANLKLDSYTVQKAATLEKNRWVLDGTWQYFPNRPSLSSYYWGLVGSTLSDSDASAGIPLMTIIITFSSTHSAYGLTFEFDNYDETNYPNAMFIQWLNDDTVLDSATYHPSGDTFSTENKVENYNKIAILIYGTNRAYRYPRIKSITHGVTKYFLQNEIISAKAVQEIDITGVKLPISKLTAKVYSPNDEFNLLNPQGLYSLIQSRQRIDVQIIYGDSTYSFNRYYIDTVEVDEDKTLTISAVDAIGVMDKTEFKGNMYNDVSSSAIILEILTDAGFSNYYSYASATMLTGYIGICSHREALQKVLFAIGANASSQGSYGRIFINKNPQKTTTYSDTITLTPNMRFEGTTMKLDELYTGVTVKEHSYSLEVDEWGEAKTSSLYSGALKLGENKIEFSSPVSPSTITTSAGTLTETGVNYAIITTTEAVGSCNVTGRKYVDETQEVTQKLESIPPGSQENISSVDCTLVSSENSATVASRYLDALQFRLEWNVKSLFYWAYPTRVRPFKVTTKEGYSKRAWLESATIDLVGGLVTDMVLKGEI